MSVVSTIRHTGIDQHGFSPDEVAAFQRDGYAIVPGLADAATCRTMLDVTRAGLTGEFEPIEYEADVHYPGAPSSRASVGGRTVRRLKQAHSRHPIFTDWVSRPELVARLQQLLGPQVVMPLAHHNCIMTKQPRFSSDTGWHQDVRYWSFTRPELVSVWLALVPETRENGCLRLIPGTHAMPFDSDRLDDMQFLKDDHPRNRPLIEQQVWAELQPGDVLFFHAKTFHAATRNFTDAPKFSVVFTFRPQDNPPVSGTRSAAMPELLLPVMAESAGSLGDSFSPFQPTGAGKPSVSA